MKVTKYIKIEFFSNLVKRDWRQFMRYLRGMYLCIYSRDGGLYYIDDLASPRDFWVSVNKDDDGKYKVYDFAFYSIHSGKDELVPRNGELAKRYKLALDKK